MAYEQPKTGLGSVEETERLLRGAEKQTGIKAPTFTSDLPYDIDEYGHKWWKVDSFGNPKTGAITSDVLSGNETSLQLPPAPTPTYTPPVIVPPPSGTAIDSKTGVATYTPPPTTPTQPKEKSLYQSTLEKLGIAGEQLAEKPEFTARVQEEAQLAQKREKQAQSYNAYQQAQLDLTRQIEALQGQGLTDVQRNAQEREIRRKGNTNIANLAVVAQADQNLLAAAEQTIKDKVDAQFSPIQDQIDWLTKFASLAQNDLSESESTILNAQVNKQQKDYDNITSIAKDLQINMQANGAPMSLYSEIDKINEDFLAGRIDVSTAQSRMLQKSGSYGRTPLKPDNQVVTLKNGSTVVVDTNTGKVISTIGGGTTLTTTLAGLTPEQQKDPFIKLLLDSEGGKPITDTFAQSLNKGLNVLSQIGVLQENIKDTKTGPIAGAFRGANPWDTNAQTIKAQLNAIVPNLARGVYGEVGVLTDNDIANYSKTLPTLSSTEDIRNAVLGITVDLIGKSIKRTLEVNAANQKDVSGFVDIYTEMINTRDSIFSQIPGYKGTGAKESQIDDVAAETVFDSVVVPESSSWLMNAWNNLFQ